jgi:hypothetical protein
MIMHAEGRKQPKPWVDFDDRTRAVLRALNAVNENGEPLRLEEGVEAIAAQLVRFDRYERRALSRRKWAIRNFDEGTTDELDLSRRIRSRIRLRGSSHKRVNSLKGTRDGCRGPHRGCSVAGRTRQEHNS